MCLHTIIQRFGWKIKIQPLCDCGHSMCDGDLCYRTFFLRQRTKKNKK